ncbi:MAG TPA: hypothetical protein VLB00_09575 [Gemmatimonadales bacterium]|nr:hypothetical protein [Gemmatimonadales bacterium]
MVRSRLFRPVLFAGLLVVVSCTDSSNPAGPEGGMLASRGQGGQPADLPSADELARQVPGFGGFYLDATGTPTVHLTRGSDRANAERALAGYLAASGLGPAAHQVLEGRYGWQQLERWQEAATMAAFESAGAVFVDNDETVNRIRIGVVDLNAMGQVRAALARSGLPDEAVIIERAEPIVMVASLQNVVDRPVRAGVQINFPGFLCSVGFNATSGGQNSMITASHCTNTQGGVESTPYWQPLQSSAPTQIAVEVADPEYTRNGPGCPRGRRCRRSDASRAVYMNGVSGALGGIARTSAANNGSLEITGSFSITADDANNSTAVGTVVNKVGRTTGWTSGTMTNKCVNTGVSGTNIVQLCQNFVTAGVAGGDSGSDVFVVTGSTSVRLLGVLWGGGGGQFVFSPLQNVIQELGPLTTH